MAKRERSKTQADKDKHGQILHRMEKDRYGKDDQAGEGWLGRIGELAGMAALAVAAPGFGEAADVALEGTIEAGEEVETATAADEAGDHGAQEAAEGKLNKLRAARQKALMRPTSVRSAMQAGREDTYLKTGELRSSYDPRNLLTDAAKTQMKANIKIPVMGAAVLTADEAVKGDFDAANSSLLGDDGDDGPTGPPAPAPAPAPAPYHPDQADLYSQNYSSLYGHTDSGRTPWG